jgi:hypothetical protein
MPQSAATASEIHEVLNNVQANQCNLVKASNLRDLRGTLLYLTSMPTVCTENSTAKLPLQDACSGCIAAALPDISVSEFVLTQIFVAALFIVHSLF